jgi:uncharacterized protein (TIGR02996 family)
MSDEAAFLDELRAAPTDDTTRLVFADWLDEHDSPRKAEYVRLVAALARAGGDLTDRPEGDALVALTPELPDDWRFVAGARFVVTLFSYGHAQKINMIKHLREATGNGLAEAKVMSEALPCRVRDGAMFDRAREIARKLRGVPEAVVAVLPTELEQLPFAVTYEVVATCGMWGDTNDHTRRAARASLANFLVRAVGMSPGEAATAAANELVVLARDLSAGEAHNRAQVLAQHRPPANFRDRWSVGVFARHVATEVE